MFLLDKIDTRSITAIREKIRTCKNTRIVIRISALWEHRNNSVAKDVQDGRFHYVTF